MKIYLDYIFLENLIINTVVIIETILFTNLIINNKRRNTIIILDTIFSCIIYVVPVLNHFAIHIVLTSFSLFILFKLKNLYEYFKAISCYYLIYFIYMGIIIAMCVLFNINLDSIMLKCTTYILSAILLHFLNKCMWKTLKDKFKIRDLYYTVKINNMEVTSFVDTGNTVKDPISNLNVIFLKKELEEIIIKDKTNKVEFEVTTVNSVDTKEGYIVKNIQVIKEGRIIANIPKIILCFSLIGNTPEKYSAIIGYDTYLENLNGGVSYKK